VVLTTADLYEVMEVVWPSGDALRGESSNHPPVLWLKTVVLNGAGEVGTRSRQVRIREMGDGWEILWPLPSEASKVFRWHQNRGLHDVPG